MGIEFRHGRVYYYRKRREGDRVVSEYIGKGMVAHYAFLQDSEAHEQRAEQRAKLAQLKQEQERIDKAIDAHHAAVQRVVVDALHLLGFHKHKRQWRLKRKDARQVTSELLEKVVGDEEREEYCRLFFAVSDKGKGKELEEYREYAQAHPQVFDGILWLPKITMDDVLSFCANNEQMKIHLRGEANALRRQLGVDTASRLEKLLIDDIAFCWLRMMAMEGIYSSNMTSGKKLSLEAVLFLEKRLSMVQRRYHNAIERLARVRGLLQRAGVQINVAQQMVVQNG